MTRPALGFSFALGTPLDQLSRPRRQRQLAKLADLGFDLVEWTTCQADAVSERRLAADLDASGVRLAALGTGAANLQEGLSLTSPDGGVRDRARERVRAAIELAGAFGAPVIVGLIRGSARGDASARGRLALELHALGELSQQNGTIIVVEPLNRYESDLLPTVDAVAALLAEVGQPAVRPMADLFHMGIEESDPHETLARRARELAYLHVADSNRLAPGHGHLPLAGLLAAASAAGYDGPLVCELLPNPTSLHSVAQASSGLRAALPVVEAIA